MVQPSGSGMETDRGGVVRPRSHRQKENRALHWENSAAVLCLTALRFTDGKVAKKKGYLFRSGKGNYTHRGFKEKVMSREIPAKLKRDS